MPSKAGSADPANAGARRRWWAMAALLCGSFMVLLDVTIVNIAMPTMTADLGASLGEIVWLSSIYALSFAVPLLLTARLGDQFGAKPLFIMGLTLFTLASAACGLADSVPALVAARAGQGIGAAAMTPQALVLITHMFGEGERGLPIGLSGTIGGIATVAAPLIGGLLVQTLGWRWIFYLNVPVGITALLLATAYLPPHRPPGSHRPVTRQRFDLIGIILLCLALAAIAFGTQQGERYAWGQVAGPLTITHLIGGGILLLALFVGWQRLNPGEPLLDLRLFGHRNYSLACLAYPSIGFAMAGLWIPLAIYLQSVLDLSPLTAGLLTAPSPIASGITAPLAGRLSDRYNGRWVALGGFSLFGAGVATLAAMAGADTNPWLLVPALVLIGIGTGGIFAPLTNLAMTGMTPRLVGTAAGTFHTIQQLGTAFGGAAVAAVLQHRLTADLPALAESQSQAIPPPYRAPFVDAVVDASGPGSGLDDAAHLTPPQGLPADIAHDFQAAGARVFDAAFSNATQTMLTVVLAILAIGVLACARMHGKNPRKRMHPRHEHLDHPGTQRQPTANDGHVSHQIGYQWQLRKLMDDRGIEATTDLRRALATRGIRLSAVAVWRLVTQPPRRLSLPVLAALCDILHCTPDDLITPSSRTPSHRSGHSENGH